MFQEGRVGQADALEIHEALLQRKGRDDEGEREGGIAGEEGQPQELGHLRQDDDEQDLGGNLHSQYHGQGPVWNDGQVASQAEAHRCRVDAEQRLGRYGDGNVEIPVCDKGEEENVCNKAEPEDGLAQGLLVEGRCRQGSDDDAYVGNEIRGEHVGQLEAVDIIPAEPQDEHGVGGDGEEPGGLTGQRRKG